MSDLKIIFKDDFVLLDSNDNILEKFKVETDTCNIQWNVFKSWSKINKISIIKNDGKFIERYLSYSHDCSFVYLVIYNDNAQYEKSVLAYISPAYARKDNYQLDYKLENKSKFLEMLKSILDTDQNINLNVNERIYNYLPSRYESWKIIWKC